MTTRAEEFAATFEATNNDLIATVEECSDAQWRMPCVDDGRSVGVVAHHVTVVYPDFARILKKLAAGAVLPPRGSMDTVHESNARHAQEYTAVGTRETLDALRQNGTEVAQLLRSLSEEQLDGIAGIFGGRELSTAQVVEWIVIGHSKEHLASIRATVAA